MGCMVVVTETTDIILIPLTHVHLSVLSLAFLQIITLKVQS